MKQAKMKQPMGKRMTKLILGMMLSLATGMVQAADGIPWQQLDGSEQQVLQPYAGRWDSMDPEQQQRLQKGAQRWAGMNSEQRKAAVERFRQWQQLPEEKKQRIRERYEQFRKLSPQQQQRLRQRMQQYQQLPPERREALRQRWEAERATQKEPASSPAATQPGREEERAAVDGETGSGVAERPAGGSGFRMDHRGMDRMPHGRGR